MELFSFSFFEVVCHTAALLSRSAEQAFRCTREGALLVLGTVTASHVRVWQYPGFSSAVLIF